MFRLKIIESRKPHLIAVDEENTKFQIIEFTDPNEVKVIMRGTHKT